VETLNRLSEKGELDIIKLSYAHYFRVLDQYLMLPHGSALGFGVGPLLIALNELSPRELQTARIAIPGKFTTANFLLQFAFPEVMNTVDMLFSDIEQAVLTGQVDAGVIIHENRFTYEAKGLRKLADLGHLWESQTGLPIPLGGIAVRRNMDPMRQQQVGELIRQSIEYGNNQGRVLSPFIQQHAQEMEESVMKQHIDLYVNQQSLALDDLGRQAIQFMFALTGITPGQKLLAE